MINYIKGDATEPVGNGYKMIVHICNDQGGWGLGFVLALSKKWNAPEFAYRKWHKQNLNPVAGHIEFALGNVQYVNINPYLTVVNMIAQAGYGDKDNPPIRYEALKEALGQVGQAALMMNASIHMPRIGCGLAGGKWDKVEKIILDSFDSETNIYVYDLE